MEAMKSFGMDQIITRTKSICDDVRQDLQANLQADRMNTLRFDPILYDYSQNDLDRNFN